MSTAVKLFFLLFATIQPVLSQTQLPTLEETRLAAEKGDPQAEHKMGEVFLARRDYATAFNWFQKAADQGVLDSQYRLGQFLLDGKPKIPKDPDKGLEWLLITANEGHKLAQSDLANCFESGKVVNRDIVEAYKWHRLLQRKPVVSDLDQMNRFVLEMTHQQIEEGEKRASEWKPHQTTAEEMLQALYLNRIVLKGIAGSAGHRMAIINGQPIERGQAAKVNVSKKALEVRCLEIKEKSVVISIEGVNQPKELVLR